MKKYGRQYFEMEAELGSDHEENDHVVKAINKNDIEEDEEGLDIDDEELIDRADVPIDFNAEQDARQKFLEDVLEDERREIERIYNGEYFRKMEANNINYEKLEQEREKRMKRIEQMQRFFESNLENPDFGQ